MGAKNSPRVVKSGSAKPGGKNLKELSTVRLRERYRISHYAIIKISHGFIFILIFIIMKLKLYAM